MRIFHLVFLEGNVTFSDTGKLFSYDSSSHLVAFYSLRIELTYTSAVTLTKELIRLYINTFFYIYKNKCSSASVRS